jgi:hypothetical protein
MLVHLFRADGRVFGVTAAADGSNLPCGLGTWHAFKTVTMEYDTPMPGVEVNECLDDIARYGFHLTDAHVRITEKHI